MRRARESRQVWTGGVLTGALVALGLVACEPGGPPPEETSGDARPGDGTRRPDIHSFARPDEARVVHMEIDWRVLFDRRVLDGKLGLRVQRSRPGPAVLRLDTRDLEILEVRVGGSGDTVAREADWLLGKRDVHLGSPLEIRLPSGAENVRIAYRTSPQATGLQWLSPEQTAGGKHPFLYSQAQAIHARSFVPCQDSPGIRVTFKATLHVPAPLTAVMAAARTGDPIRDEDGWTTATFEMGQAIPTYLIALGVGELAFGKVGRRTGVWAEPALLERAVWEFADMERMLETGEALYGPYRWGRYDILVLPPSFPFGGMENPTLTFATPTVLAGDRSLVSLVAHELAHSWSGNLVSNATWSDFWLNEGFTTYFERRIMEALYSAERAEMEWMLGRRDLDDELSRLADSPGDQVLDIDLAGRDPDDGMTSIAYEKGALFLRRLEDTYGRVRLDSFLRAWFDEHAFTSVTTDTFESFLRDHLLARPASGAAAPDIDAWIRQPGLPGDAPRAASGALTRVEDGLRRFLSGQAKAADLDTSSWTTHHWLHLIQSLPDDLTTGQMGELDAAFSFTATGNAEILDLWLVQAIRHDYRPALAHLQGFLTEQGRRKFLTPLYRELVKTEEGRERARAIYATARPLYHAISRRTLDEIVGWP